MKIDEQGDQLFYDQYLDLLKYSNPKKLLFKW